MRSLREDAGLGPKAQRRGKELRLLESLPMLDWPTDLYNRPLTIKQLMAQPLTQQKVTSQDLCACGCGKPHRNNHPQTIRSPYGTGWQLLYFATDACKSRYNATKAA